MAGLGIAKLQFKASGPAAPTLNSVSAYTYQPIDCGQPWILTVDWYTTNDNDSLYQINVYAYPGSGSPIASGQTSASAFWDDDTGLTGSYLYQDYTHSRRYTVKLIRISDSQVLGELNTDEVTIDSGPAC